VNFSGRARDQAQVLETQEPAVTSAFAEKAIGTAVKMIVGWAAVSIVTVVLALAIPYVFALLVPHVPVLAKHCEVKSPTSIHCKGTW
jgi:hypothetical protein